MLASLCLFIACSWPTLVQASCTVLREPLHLHHLLCSASLCANMDQAIQQSLEENGAIRLAIEANLTTALGEQGVISTRLSQVTTYADEAAKSAIERGLEESGDIHTKLIQLVQFESSRAVVAAASPGGIIESAVEKLIRSEFDKRADAEYPFRAHLRSMTPRDFAAAWKAIVIDPDHMHALNEAMAEGSMATIMGLSAAHPSNTELADLKRHVTMKHAPHTKWKALCLPSHGGGADRLQVFLSERTQSPDHNIKALARSLLHLYLLVERRFTVMQNLKKSGPVKSEQERASMMPYMYEVIKAYKRRTIKATAAISLDDQVLLRDHGADLVLGHVKLSMKEDAKKRPAASSLPGVGEPATKAPRLDANPAPSRATAPAGTGSQPFLKPSNNDSAARAGNGDKGAKKRSLELTATLKAELKNFVVGKSSTEIQTWLDSKFGLSPDHRRSMGQLVRDVCRNCLHGGRGVVEHGLRKCKELGHACCIPCTKCMARGRHEVHWADDCPHQG